MCYAGGSSVKEPIRQKESDQDENADRKDTRLVTMISGI